MSFKKALVLLPVLVLLIIGGALLLLSFKTKSHNNHLISLHQQQIWLNLHTKSFLELIKDNLKLKKITFNNHKGEFEYQFSSFGYKAIIFELPNPYGVDLFFIEIFATLHYNSQDFSNNLHFFISL
ncbi:hypothetical protein B6S12_04840 [Helicobacter valdiviensis]|uniref:Uncharacterized protein n=1 Tax=Helicobacter valdiviensis TaxID=1458358 RepID=A0A2W6MY73_9HELI|nr:hypothetical protein [Helicobacter valdiviensis]PZT48258.1 hypothetical protein B6S12_04840 [Helicobacter valdiviensis]